MSDAELLDALSAFGDLPIYDDAFQERWRAARAVIHAHTKEKPMPETLPPFPTLDNIEWTDDELRDIGRRFIDAMKAVPDIDTEVGAVIRTTTQLNFVIGELERTNDELCAEVDRLRAEVDQYLGTIRERDDTIDRKHYLIILGKAIAQALIDAQPAQAYGIAKQYMKECERDGI